MNFINAQRLDQIDWWKRTTNDPNWDNVNNFERWGKQNNRSYPHIVNSDLKHLLWKGIQIELPRYIYGNIQPHSGIHNLLSSWIACANLYFPTKLNLRFNEQLLGFLKAKISYDIVNVTNVELEFSLSGELSPENLLGEAGGIRGAGQTSPDVAFEVETVAGKGLILTECKYTEHGFYSCSALRKKGKSGLPDNPNPDICRRARADGQYINDCHQKVWGRKYLDFIEITTKGKEILTRCPAATAGYQLLRQQALANGIYKNGDYSLVVSAVSFDGRNKALIRCLSSTGISDFQNGWKEIYEQGALFEVWHHQDWVNHIRNNNDGGYFDSWLNYMSDRYGY